VLSAARFVRGSISFIFEKAQPLLARRYDELVADGAITRDPAQYAALGALDRLLGELAANRLPWSLRRRRGARGVYLWGEIGHGKTTLMDLFFDAAPVRRKRRTHFHAFMAEVHARLHAARRRANGGLDPLSRVAAELASETTLLCFDEFSVFDIADATILARLFSALMAAGSSSSRPLMSSRAGSTKAGSIAISFCPSSTSSKRV